jgi:vacuolar protein sorting-associated protein 13D
MERIDETAHDPQHALIAATRTAKRFYFGTLKLALNQVKLSVTRSHKLSQDLVAVKRKLGLSLIAFEDALIDLDPFIRVHPFETINFLTNSVVKHYTDELLSQAVLILGATDFLGNPIGFLNDIHEGVSSLLSDGDVGGLLKSVTHGAANSAAKVSGSLSYGISKATVYDKYNEKRLMLRRQRGDTSKEYLVDGLKGLGFGVVQGLTSIVTETYEGVANDGLSGFFSGLTWGLIGTVSKPALGVLDLATGAATAVKESSRSKYRELPPKLRPPRLVLGSGGNLPIYTTSDALGQALLYRLNGRDITEIYVAHEQLRTGPEENLQLLLSCDRVLIFTTHHQQQPASTSTSAASNTTTSTSSVESPTAASSAADLKELRIMINISHVDLVCARTVSSPGDGSSSSSSSLAAAEDAPRYYIELVGQFDDNETRKRPQVRCDNERIARRVTQKINYARNIFDEMTQAVIEGNDNHENEL